MGTRLGCESNLAIFNRRALYVRQAHQIDLHLPLRAHRSVSRLQPFR